MAGDPVSYQYGRTNNPAIAITTPSGATAAAGIQGFPGYTPATAVAPLGVVMAMAGLLVRPYW